jgi:ABC-2 type transport system ATP-binding protein
MNPVIEVKNVTKDYGNGRGIFHENLTVNQGEMLGFVGTNGSGKTTTIRCLMGFIKPTAGHCYVNGLESYTHASEIAKSIGYVPGEIAFPDLGTGNQFLKSQAEFLGLKI